MTGVIVVRYVALASVEGFHTSMHSLARSRGTYDCLKQAIASKTFKGAVMFTTADGETRQLVRGDLPPQAKR